MTVSILQGDARAILATLPNASAQMVLTSPPYYRLRSYLPTEHPDAGKEIGNEMIVGSYVNALVATFREVRRVLCDDGVVFLNIGDTYASSSTYNAPRSMHTEAGWKQVGRSPNAGRSFDGKPKDLLMVPARVAIALCDDGWYLRADNVWCLSGGTRIYARVQKGDMPMTIDDMVRLDPATVQLWNGERWTRALGWSKTQRPDRTYEIELRNGQRIGCTGPHLWPTQRGDVRSDEIVAGDVIATCKLPEPSPPHMPSALDDNLVGWFVGLYLAEGSRSEDTIQISSHLNESERLVRLQEIAYAFDGSISLHKISENGCTINLCGAVLRGVLETYIWGKIASDKHLSSRCWQRSNAFLAALLDGYLSGDGYYDAGNDRWCLGFCNNDALASDLRTLGARLGVSVRLRRYVHKFGNGEFPGWRGELRFVRSAHPNSKQDGEVIAIRESRARTFWDIGVADDPHIFALASGVLTHNSKPNGMPESVTDRTTRAHEYVFMLSKSERYYYDREAVRTAPKPSTQTQLATPYLGQSTKDHAAAGVQDASDIKRRIVDKQRGHSRRHAGFNDRWNAMERDQQIAEGGNLRSVWWISPAQFGDGHFAVMPNALAEICIRAGSKPRDTVLDPFSGVATTALVARALGRNAIGIELNEEYIRMSWDRLQAASPFERIKPAADDHAAAGPLFAAAP